MAGMHSKHTGAALYSREADVFCGCVRKGLFLRLFMSVFYGRPKGLDGGFW